MTAGVTLVADAGERAGLGHVARCSAIAAALRARGLEVSAHALGADGPVELDGIHWRPLESAAGLRGAATGPLVLDSYVMSGEEVGELCERFATVTLDDLGSPPPGAELVVAVGSESPAASRVLGGLRHAPLRRGYWGLPSRELAGEVRQVLVTTGGFDPSDAGAPVAGAARDALPDAQLTLVRGPFAGFDPPDGVRVLDAPKSLLDELLRADIVVTGAGQTALEASATGAPSVVLPLVENQRRNAAALLEAGAARVVEPSAEGAARALRELAGDPALRAGLSRRAQAAVDGYGALRIAFRVEQLLRG